MIISQPGEISKGDSIPAGVRKIQVLDLPLLSGEPTVFAQWIISLASTGQSTPAIIEHVNLNNHFLISSDQDLALQLTTGARLIFEGIGMEVAALILGLGRHNDTNGTDLFPVVAAMAQEKKIAVYFLGSSDETVKTAAEHVQLRFPGIVIAGYRSGYFSVEEEESIVRDINRSNTKLLLVGLGVPQQEYFVLRNRERLDVSVIWSVGGLFDFLSGAKPRAPLLVRTLRLEWLFRFLLEPRRMWRRNLIIPPRFFAQVLKQAWYSRFLRGTPHETSF